MYLSGRNNPELNNDHHYDDEQVDSSCSGDDDEDGNDTQLGTDDKRRAFKSNAHQLDVFEEDDLFVVMRLPMLIGYFWGLPPLIGLWKRRRPPQTTSLCRSWLQCQTLISLIIIFFIGCNTLCIGLDFAIQFSCQKSIGDTIQKATGVWFYSTGLFVYLFCLLRSPKSTDYGLYWRKVSRKMKGTIVSCPHLARDMNLICFVILLSAVGENIFFHIYSMRTGNLLSQMDKGVTLDDFLQDYFKSNQYMSLIFNYNPVISAIHFFINKCTLFSWNYGDIVIMMICRALYGRFVGLNRYLHLHLDSNGPVPVFKKGTVSWRRVRRNFLLIITLLDKADQIFYPLMWVSYTTNIIFVCNQLFMGIRNTSIKTAVHRTYVVWSLGHLILRTFFLNILAARINEHAHKISKLLQFCSCQEYDHNVRRLETFISSRVIGITANGIFVVTRYFILMIISAIFTLEVVLLQNSK